MPYILPADRPMFDTMIDGLVNRARHFNRATMRKVVANLVSYGLTRMPYLYDIDPQTDEVCKNLAKRIRVRGDANYVICRVVLESMKPEKGWSYHSLSDTISVIRSGAMLIEFKLPVPPLPIEEEEMMEDCCSICNDAADEIRRRLLDPYEDKAIFKNGDMACFANEDFAYLPPLDIDFELYGDPISGVGGCGGNCTCKDTNSLPPVAEAATDVPLSEAFTQDQYDAIEHFRKHGQYRDPSQPPPSPLPRDVTADEVERAARKGRAAE